MNRETERKATAIAQVALNTMNWTQEETGEDIIETLENKYWDTVEKINVLIAENAEELERLNDKELQVDARHRAEKLDYQKGMDKMSIMTNEERKEIESKGLNADLVEQARYMVGAADFVFAFRKYREDENLDVDEMETAVYKVTQEICKLVTENAEQADKLYTQCLREMAGKY